MLSSLAGPSANNVVGYMVVAGGGGGFDNSGGGGGAGGFREGKLFLLPLYNNL